MVGECQPILGQLVGMEVSRDILHKVPAIHLKAEKLGPRDVGVKEVMFEWFSFAGQMSGKRVISRTLSHPVVINAQCCKFLLIFSYSVPVF